jgi:cullin 3
MKSRQTLSHPNLIAEATKLLSSRFIPTPAALKGRIDNLIEKEFIERVPNDRCVVTWCQPRRSAMQVHV